MRRPSEAGQALILALLVLFLTSVAAAVLGLGLALDQRAILDEMERARSRQLLDGALADALARRHENSFFTRHEEEFGGGEIRSAIVSRSPIQFDVAVVASYRGRRRAARSRVQILAGGKFRVLSWSRIPPPPSIGER
ncbi:MAG: hypothetical protein K8J08_00920 [Thermoanaerobaculia bacterium]|nr:hypothetical protein [Thermoanaerobaculia bacterium]